MKLPTSKLHLGLAASRPLRAALPRPVGRTPAQSGIALIIVMLVILVLAMLAGGFVAGIRAGFSYNTFPLMDGRLVPEGYWDLTPALKNFTANIAAVQFNHRLLASAVLVVAVIAGALAWRRLPAGFARNAVLALTGAVALQYALGIATLLAVVPVWLGTLHQSIAVLVLASALAAIHGLRQPRATASLNA